MEQDDISQPEVIRDKTNADAELPNVSNCAFAGGLLLGQLADIAQVTHDPTAESRRARFSMDWCDWRGRAHARALWLAASCPAIRPRRTLRTPRWISTHFSFTACTSTITPGLPGEAEKRTMRELMAEICAMIEHDGTILASNGAPAWVSDIEAIRSDRSSRMLEVFLVGYDITGDRHLRDVYLEKVREGNYGRLRSILDPQGDPVDLFAAGSALWPGVRRRQQHVANAVFAGAAGGTGDRTAVESGVCGGDADNARIAARYGKSGVELQIIMLAAESRRRSVPCARRMTSVTAWRSSNVVPRSWPPRRDGGWTGQREILLAASITSVGVDLPAAADTFWTGLRLHVF